MAPAVKLPGASARDFDARRFGLRKIDVNHRRARPGKAAARRQKNYGYIAHSIAKRGPQRNESCVCMQSGRSGKFPDVFGNYRRLSGSPQ
ncbi:hypothetical protein KCP71_10725 [Salmonella enterica subsp. enterica]|nr:hypothetical protein KCP71_10725 [Salmonella enterica subsp. enterica]